MHTNGHSSPTSSAPAIALIYFWRVVYFADGLPAPGYHKYQAAVVRSREELPTIGEVEDWRVELERKSGGEVFIFSWSPLRRGVMKLNNSDD